VPSQVSVDDDGNEYEPYGALKLYTNGGKTGYKNVYQSRSAKKPFQAMIINKRNGKQQGLGSFKTAKEAAVTVAIALTQGDDEDMDSPRKQRARGAHASPRAPARRDAASDMRLTLITLAAAALAGSVHAARTHLRSSSNRVNRENESPTTQPARAFTAAAPVIATPTCLPCDVIAAMAVHGIVGTAVCL
jgi:hypothetical protein